MTIAFGPPATEQWRIGLVASPIASALDAETFAKAPVTWIVGDPDPFRFLADPFGVVRGGRRYVFAEALDYRDKRGVIDVVEFDETGAEGRRATALSRPFHLSYPFVIAERGVDYMLPEAFRSGRLTIYAAEAFPDRWVPVADVLDVPAIDASPIFWDGLWWMFYALPGRASQSEMHAAYADSLLGPWRPHRSNPVRRSASSARMGGTPFSQDGRLHLPVQDCSDGYGRAVKVLRVEALAPDRFEAREVATLGPGSWTAPYIDGLHTLSACGDATLIDAKRVVRRWDRAAIDMRRRLRRAFR